MGVRAWWEQRVLPRVIDRSMSNPATDPWRERTCAPAHGDVLELGFGSGLNLKFYGDGVHRVLAVEPSELAWELAQRRIAHSRVPVEHVGLDGARVDLPDASADTVVSTLTLCTIPDVESALQEVRRLLRPGGELRFTDHGLADDPDVARRQRRIQRWWGPIGGGCHVDRDIPRLLEDAGFDVRIDRQGFVLSGISKPFTWFTSGSATVSGVDDPLV